MKHGTIKHIQNNILIGGLLKAGDYVGLMRVKPVAY